MSIKGISDLKVWGQHFVFNMDTICFQYSEKYNYLPFTRLGLRCYFMEILHLMCASLWIITSVVGWLFQWKLEYFIILGHVGHHVYYHVHCLPLHNKALEIMIKGLNICIITFHLVNLLQETVSKLSLIIKSKKVMVVHMYCCRFNIFSKCQCFMVIVIYCN